MEAILAHEGKNFGNFQKGYKHSLKLIIQTANRIITI